MTNQFFIVRHGESENNVLEIYNSRINEINRYGLTDTGRHQVMDAAKNIKKLHKVFASPFRRTVETAEIFREQTGADLIIDHRLREIDLGTHHSHTHVDIPNVGEDEPIFDGESVAQIRDRMWEFITDINAQHQDQQILIVTHGGPMEILRHYWNHDHPFEFTGVANTPKNGQVTLLG